MSRDAEVRQKKAQATQSVTAPHASERIASPMQKFPRNDKSVPGPAGNRGLGQVNRKGAVGGELLDPCRPTNAAATIEQRMRPPFRPYKFRFSPIAAVIAALIIATRWIPYDRGPGSPVADSSPQRSNAARQKIRFVPAKPRLSERALKARTAVGRSVKAPNSAFTRVQVGPNEVDYIAEDVTIRHFTHKPAPPRVQRGYKEVHIGADVTIRYFPSQPVVVARTRPLSTAAQ
jgi:hypothetical protein